mmetsp:Transcript_14513/g.21394  ORF Transcript_14513/g.21394 Transcript_14513/m.21394 type:complete len:229 (-) Transcript_14513:373-1059(-)|eukprot:CAMPEP_0195508636 /NCGR_PEP_ID=MMETSP0794_2-20130614/1791_1 /TAXON_ID=515487 /ORGANISM="Stephanopyxis turris, Strain CCMP 815" /LENGTH=228 /DNA_ID=CAMNT_0040635645 /DNA_START=59 /DNA_END=745 /DNA_ORIENTATION=+
MKGLVCYFAWFAAALVTNRQLAVNAYTHRVFFFAKSYSAGNISVHRRRLRTESSGRHTGCVKITAFNLANNENSIPNDEEEIKVPLLLPTRGTSAEEMMKNNEGQASFSSSSTKENSAELKLQFMPRKFQLQYTCNLCETKNTNKISRKAYREGVVIAVCKGCKCKHLIADNLGWSKYINGFNDGETNIEEFFQMKGQEDRVNRVSQDVWELEQIHQIAIDDGSRQME